MRSICIQHCIALHCTAYRPQSARALRPKPKSKPPRYVGLALRSEHDDLGALVLPAAAGFSPGGGSISYAELRHSSGWHTPDRLHVTTTYFGSNVKGASAQAVLAEAEALKGRRFSVGLRSLIWIRPIVVAGADQEGGGAESSTWTWTPLCRGGVG